MTQYRAHFDATVEFTNGGGLTATGFRLDLPDRDVDVAPLFIQHLGLALVGKVELTNLEIVEEQHRGSRHVPVAARPEHRLVDTDRANNVWGTGPKPATE